MGGPIDESAHRIARVADQSRGGRRVVLLALALRALGRGRDEQPELVLLVVSVVALEIGRRVQRAPA